MAAMQQDREVGSKGEEANIGAWREMNMGGEKG
jgi:hypothetical protein